MTSKYLIAFGLLGLLYPYHALADGLALPDIPAIGTNSVATADPLVVRPATKPCVVELLDRHEFVGEAPVALNFSPPEACPGPWAKVVVETDFNVTKGRQFDRSAILNLAGVNLYLGTTMEPRRDIAPEWHAERDVTDYSRIFTTPQTGEFLLANYVDDTYTGHLFGRARLLFYPLDTASKPDTPQLVIPLGERQQALTKAEPSLTKVVLFPRNMERLMIDVMVEPQGDDEFWYGCVPDRFVTGTTDACGGGSLRETEVAIDGVLAGVAPIYPWIYTGGINPYMWFPSPAVETLNFTPYRVDLTPFASLLTDGQPHKITLEVLGVRRYALAMGTLLAWLDPNTDVVTGGLVRNTLKAPDVEVDDDRLHAVGKQINGRISTTLKRDYEITGYVDTSHGRVTTRLKQIGLFTNQQVVSNAEKAASWQLTQDTHLWTTVETEEASGTVVRTVEEDFPLTIEQKDQFHADYGIEDMKIHHGLKRVSSQKNRDGTTDMRTVEISTSPNLHALLDAKTHRTKTATSTSSHHVKISDHQGVCFERTIDSRNNVVVSTVDGKQSSLCDLKSLDGSNTEQ
jgi:hypothetical protein